MLYYDEMLQYISFTTGGTMKKSFILVFVIAFLMPSLLLAGGTGFFSRVSSVEGRRITGPQRAEQLRRQERDSDTAEFDSTAKTGLDQAERFKYVQRRMEELQKKLYERTREEVVKEMLDYQISKDETGSYEFYSERPKAHSERISDGLMHIATYPERPGVVPSTRTPQFDNEFQIDYEVFRRLGMVPEAFGLDRDLMELDARRRLGTEKFQQDMVELETRRRIGLSFGPDMFGREFFAEGEVAGIGLSTGVAPSDYKLGPGDELKIIIWSELGDETVYDVMVNPEGQVYVPILGILKVSGLTVNEFEQKVIGQLSQKFRHFRGQVTLNRVRSIQIFAVGEVERPGALTVSGLATAFVGLYNAGGPTPRGSMRRIRVLSSDGKTHEIDFYRYLLSGDSSQDVSLQSGDTIFVPAIEKRVEVKGMVTRPAVYEILSGTTLAQTLEMAGNPLAEAYAGRINVIRWRGTEKRESYDISLQDIEKLNSFTLVNGDVINISRAIERVANKVVVEGAVHKPGEYSAKPGLTVFELISRAGGLIEDKVSMRQAHIYRKVDSAREEIVAVDLRYAMINDTEHNVEIMPKDRLRIYFDREVKENERFVVIEGAVRRPGEYIFRDGMRLADLILRARGLSAEASGDVEIARIAHGRTSEIFNVDAKEAVLNTRSADNKLLRPRDRISVRKSGEMARHAEMVTLEGFVKRPGPYAIKHPGETLSSLIERAGGLTAHAFPKGAVFMRRMDSIMAPVQVESAFDVQQEMFANASMNLRARLLSARANLSSENIQEIFEGLEMQYRPLKQESLRIPVALDKILAGRAEPYEDLPLMDGDHITIPQTPSTVSVLGAVVNPTAIMYSGRRSARHYIDRAGGFSAHSNHRRSVVVRANGEVFPMRRVRRIERGDIILVPPSPRIVRPDRLKEVSELVSVLGNLAVFYKVVTD